MENEKCALGNRILCYRAMSDRFWALKLIKKVLGAICLLVAELTKKSTIIEQDNILESNRQSFSTFFIHAWLDSGHIIFYLLAVK